MQRLSCLVILLALLLASAACTPTFQGVPLLTPVPASPTLAKDDPIKTYAQYKEAVKDAETKVPPTLAQTIGPQRLVAYTREIAKLPSRQSRDYANALAFKLFFHGVFIQLPPSNGNRPDITYSELAMIDALTQAAVVGPDRQKNKNIPEKMRISESTLNAFFITIAAKCPSDSSAGWGVSGMYDHPVDTDRRSQVPAYIWGRADIRRAEGLLFNRHVCSFRPMNLTSLSFYDDNDLVSNEGLAYYSFAIGHGFISPPLGQLTKPALHGLIDAMVDSARRAKSIDSSPETQKMLDDFITDRGNPQNFPDF